MEPIRFDVRLRFGYLVRVAVWETRAELKTATGAKRMRKVLHGLFDESDGKALGTIHLCRQSSDDGTLLHEVTHVMWTWRERVESRFTDPHRFNEANAQVTEAAFLTLRSNVRAALRLEQHDN